MLCAIAVWNFQEPNLPSCVCSTLALPAAEPADLGRAAHLIRPIRQIGLTAWRCRRLEPDT